MTGKVFKRTARESKIWFEVELDDGSLRRFDCRDQVPGGIVLSVANLVDPDMAAMDRGAAAVDTITRLLKAAIVKPQQARFWAMVQGEDEDGMIDVPQLMEIASALAEEYTERPTGEPSEPGSPPTVNGVASTPGASPAGVTTYSRSLPSGPSTLSKPGAKSNA
jgi:hypothetical protein